MVALNLVSFLVVTGTLLGDVAAAPSYNDLQARGPSRGAGQGAWKLCPTDVSKDVKSTQMIKCFAYAPEAANFGKCSNVKGFMDGSWSLSVGSSVSCKVSSTADCSCPKPEDCKEVKGAADIKSLREEYGGTDSKSDWAKSVQCKKI